MLEYLNFCLLCAILVLIIYLYIRIKKYFPILKMAEELIGNLGYEAPQSDTKCQKLLECLLTGNSKLYLGKIYTEDQLTKLSDNEVEKLFNNYEAKLLGQMVKSLGKSIINNKKRSHTQLDSRKQVIAFQDRVITINIKEAQHPLK